MAHPEFRRELVHRKFGTELAHPEFRRELVHPEFRTELSHPKFRRELVHTKLRKSSPIQSFPPDWMLSETGKSIWTLVAQALVAARPRSHLDFN